MPIKAKSFGGYSSRRAVNVAWGNFWKETTSFGWHISKPYDFVLAMHDAS